jgi:hypothetical protein
VTLSGFDLHSADDLDDAFGDMQKRSMEAVIVVAGNLTYANYRRISELALQAHLPSCTAFREAVMAGGLVSIGPDLVDMVRQVPVYLDDHAWSQAGRPSCRGADPVRHIPQSQNSDRARTDDPNIADRHRRRGDRIEFHTGRFHFGALRSSSLTMLKAIRRRFVARKPLRCHPPVDLVLKIDVGESLAVAVALDNLLADAAGRR